MEGSNEMTDKQAMMEGIKTRLDELNRLEEHTKDGPTLEYIQERKKALRQKLDTI